MPFLSYKQQKYLFAKHPKTATRWAKKYRALNKPAKYRHGPKIRKRK